MSDIALYSDPLYSFDGRTWSKSFTASFEAQGRTVELDPAGVLSLLGFGYVCGNRTLVKGVSRKPWLSSLGPEGTFRLQPIPRHGLLLSEPAETAQRLEALMLRELEEITIGRDQVFLTLSGGLDSRIVAGLVAKAAAEGRIPSRITAVTWGLEDSRDVIYAHRVAQILGLDWEHVPLVPDDVWENIKESAIVLGAMTWPHDLHGVQWFRRVPRSAIVLSASYGDGIGRAEFSRRHLLELRPLAPSQLKAPLLTSVARVAGISGVKQDLDALRLRAGESLPWAICEHEMQCHYMRGLLGPAMSVISAYCDHYQMFTAPSVYSYAWSVHPSYRSDHVYAHMLNHLRPDIRAVPWARTIRALAGPTVGADSKLRRDFHKYEEWLSGELYERVRDAIDLEILESTGIFSRRQIVDLCEVVRKRSNRFPDYGLFAWLASLSFFLRACGSNLIPLAGPKSRRDSNSSERDFSGLRVRLSRRRNLLRPLLRAREVLRHRRRKAHLKNAIRDYPPEPRREDCGPCCS